MNNSSLKNWKPREVVAFLLKQGFVEIKKKGGGDHKCLLKKENGAYTEVDMGKKSFSAREMLTFTKQTLIPRKLWKK
ncbi:MAG: type II toxin-antitoxin system HicA family toxin [Candidatus Gracilibacteria bacterium]|jgi:predicted RNA binding protein YcfA (HicA-like mRNA interferase family)